MSDRAIVLDANILIRAVLGRRVRDLIFDNLGTVKFFAPDVAFTDARKYLPALLKKRGIDPSAAMLVLNHLEGIVQSIDAQIYQSMQQQALQRIEIRDADDWPVLACAMTLGCPIWTEDTDFFGTGVAIWTSDRIALYLASDRRK
jgi:predicted nucleic acid-binding protein